MFYCCCIALPILLLLTLARIIIKKKLKKRRKKANAIESESQSRNVWGVCLLHFPPPPSLMEKCANGSPVDPVPHFLFATLPAQAALLALILQCQ